MPKRLTSCVAPTIASLRGRIRRWTRPSTRPILGAHPGPVPVARGPGPRKCAPAQAARGRLPADRPPAAHPGGSGDARAPRSARPDVAERHAPAVQPETILRWHRQGFRLFWRRTSKRAERQPRIAAETIALIEQHGHEQPALGRRADPRRAAQARHPRRQAHDPEVHAASPQPRPPGQRWATFLRNHAHETWACDFLQTYDLLFRPLFAFFFIELGSRRVVHVGVTRSPSTRG